MIDRLLINRLQQNRAHSLFHFVIAQFETDIHSI